MRVLAVPLFGQVLEERAAADEAEQLHAVADAERRDAQLERGLRQRDVEVLLGARHGLRGRMRGAEAEPRGVEVVAAGEHETVDALEQPADVARPADRRDRHGHAPGLEHGVGVAVLERDRRARALGHLAVDGDERPFAVDHGRILLRARRPPGVPDPSARSARSAGSSSAPRSPPARRRRASPRASRRAGPRAAAARRGSSTRVAALGAASRAG